MTKLHTSALKNLALAVLLVLHVLRSTHLRGMPGRYHGSLRSTHYRMSVRDEGYTTQCEARTRSCGGPKTEKLGACDGSQLTV